MESLKTNGKLQIFTGLCKHANFDTEYKPTNMVEGLCTGEDFRNGFNYFVSEHCKAAAFNPKSPRTRADRLMQRK